MNSGPLISVCMPAYNTSRYIAEAISSVLAQTYTNWELIVVDDGSTDNTYEIASSFTDPRIQVVSQENSNQCVANNNAFGHSKGEFIKFFDSDDIMNPTMLESQVKRVLENPNKIISSAWGRFYKNDLHTFKLSTEPCWKDMDAPDWLCSNWEKGAGMMQCGIFLINRKLILSAGLWNESLSLINDLEFFTRLMIKSDGVFFTSGGILYYRSGISSALSATSSKPAIISGVKSLLLSTSYLLEIRKDEAARLACVNIMQQFVYHYYPRNRDCLAVLEEKINTLIRPTVQLKYPALMRPVAYFFGWKAVKWLQFLKNSLTK